jgi:hypothetical protein
MAPSRYPRVSSSSNWNGGSKGIGNGSSNSSINTNTNKRKCKRRRTRQLPCEETGELASVKCRRDSKPTQSVQRRVKKILKDPGQY